MKVREVVSYNGHFENFLKELSPKVQNKIYKVIEAVETLERIPKNYLKQITSVKGLYETRVRLASNIWRVFCFFDDDKLVILLNGFQKKSQKTPKSEIDKAKILMEQYYNDKKSKL